MSIAHGEMRFSAQHNKFTRKYHISMSAQNATRRTDRLHFNQGDPPNNQIVRVIQTISKLHPSPTNAQIVHISQPHSTYPNFLSLKSPIPPFLPPWPTSSRLIPMNSADSRHAKVRCDSSPS
jgi:hypothetical protein